VIGVALEVGRSVMSGLDQFTIDSDEEVEMEVDSESEDEGGAASTAMSKGFDFDTGDLGYNYQNAAVREAQKQAAKKKITNKIVDDGELMMDENIDRYRIHTAHAYHTPHIPHSITHQR
jgi:hypothetical protein